MHFNFAVPVNDGIANAAGIRKVCIPPQQIVRLGVIVILPPEAVAGISWNRKTNKRNRHRAFSGEAWFVPLDAKMARYFLVIVL